MTRVKRGSVARKRRNKILKWNKGFQGSHSKTFRAANQQAIKALCYGYIDRRKRKINFRRLWIRRINASSRSYGVNYNQFIYGLKQSSILLNRKVISQLSILDPVSFKKLLFCIKDKTVTSNPATQQSVN
jgi:large subunit ribosomal protein L20